MDIVGRLRSWFNYDLCDYIEPAIPDIREAADEIERLRQQNAELVEALKDLVDDSNCPSPSVQYAKSAITKATGGE